MSKKKSAKKRAATAPVMATATQAKTPMSMSPRVASVAKSGKPAPIIASSAEAIAQAQAGFGEEYRYVFTDLKRIGLIAAGMFVLLIALALIVR